ncbi:sulfurtransferase TusA family protein [Beggiatoa leptomitoformis]|uniref:SirA family protein n=1 Tax=Beggiatoa leptomitoformis TaxID=288004 RepID=A0A2N9YHS2_9GAMM|nr:sulfurtransferase TusA family protein [Beggiatoa leptomitoformis]ALG67744.1 SirA family protein [Beggiatoa leptomitoformis]AUI70013.1 SirA family protein [Beggiatoa leptomitoformis]
MIEFTKELDASGLNCPLPILKTKKELNTMQMGEILHILTTDPGSVKDFDAFARQTGNKLLASTEENGKYSFLIEKAK